MSSSDLEINLLSSHHACDFAQMCTVPIVMLRLQAVPIVMLNSKMGKVCLKPKTLTKLGLDNNPICRGLESESQCYCRALQGTGRQVHAHTLYASERTLVTIKGYRHCMPALHAGREL